ncbi:MAG: hypothetical protein ACLR2O_10720 [Coprococcus sp.]
MLVVEKPYFTYKPAITRKTNEPHCAGAKSSGSHQYSKNGQGSKITLSDSIVVLWRGNSGSMEAFAEHASRLKRFLGMD